MSCLGPEYKPVPARIWSRVGSSCVYTNNNYTSYNSDSLIYLPQIQKKVPIALVPEELLMYNKGNILQYKNNSSNLTKNQRYSQIAKGKWVNRTTTWTTQNQKYTNPNTKSLLRVNYDNIYLISGLKTSNPITCDPNTPPKDVVVANGGNLVCNATQDCTGNIITKSEKSICNPTSNSDVPGQIINLCWNSSNPTWYPKNRTIMNSSGGNKFPQGYKFFKSANSIPSGII